MTPNTSSRKGFKKTSRMILPVLIIAIGIIVAVYFKKTAPSIKRTPPKQTVPSVEVITAVRKDAKRIIEVMGTVAPARKISLRSRVSGEILFVSSDFLPGGRVASGEVLLKIDPTDYQVEVEKAKSALDTKKAALSLEEGNQSIAREEMRLMSETSSEAIEATELALRKPQLQQAKAAVASAEADLKKAKLNLERTIVRAPFNTLITERNVNLGAHIGVQEVLSVLVGTDEFWIEAAVPLDQLSAVNMDRKNGSQAVIRSQGSTADWFGRALHTTGTLNEKSRMANMVIAVPDPLGLHTDSATTLMLDDYVTVSIEGKTMKGVVELPRTALRDGNTVWVFEKGKLRIRNAGILWKQGERIFIDKGVDAGDAVIISTISTPVDGMRLSITGSAKEEKKSDRPTQEEMNDDDD
jgi:RND family efflux transporter MFP subunit